MIQRKTLLIVLGGAILLSSLAPRTAFSAGNDEPTIIAVGDIHGDYEAFRSILSEASLIDSDGDWTGGDKIFVQTGDIPDRGPDTRRILEHLQKLQKQAKKSKGEVVTLLGNHEALNITRDLRYVHKGEYDAFTNKRSDRVRNQTYEANRQNIELSYQEKDPTLTPEDIKRQWEAEYPLGALEHQVAWSPRGEVGKWVIKNKAVAIVNGNLFAHGGLSEKYTAYDISDINKAAKQALKNQDLSLESIINDPLGPLWYRGLVQRDAAKPIEGESTLSREEELNLILDRYDAKRVIVGHTPSVSGIKAHFGSKLIQIDTGASAYYSGTRSYLRIEGDKVYAHDNGVVRALN